MENPTPTCIEEGCTNERPKLGGRLCHTCRNSLHKYRINTPQRDAMLRDQDDRCAACNSPVYFKNGNHSGAVAGKMGNHYACVDHNHDTGSVRGILCGRCNIILGHVRDNQRILLDLARYLSNHMA